MPMKTKKLMFKTTDAEMKEMAKEEQDALKAKLEGDLRQS